MITWEHGRPVQWFVRPEFREVQGGRWSGCLAGGGAAVGEVLLGAIGDRFTQSLG
jgi:hypothetical protein